MARNKIQTRMEDMGHLTYSSMWCVGMIETSCVCVEMEKAAQRGNRGFPTSSEKAESTRALFLRAFRFVVSFSSHLEGE